MTPKPNELITVPKIGVLKICTPTLPSINVFGPPHSKNDDDSTTKGKTIIVTATTDSVELTINNTKRTYAVTPNKPTKVVIDDEITSLSEFAKGIKTITALDLSKLKITNAISLSNAFDGCSKLASLLLPNVKANYVQSAFRDMSDITSLDASKVDISDATSVHTVFSGMSKLTTLDISTWDFSSVNNNFSWINNCNSLEDLKFGYNLKISTSFNGRPLTHESALSVINGLAEVTTAQTLTFKSTTYNTLTDEEIALATSKGWTVVSA